MREQLLLIILYLKCNYFFFLNSDYFSEWLSNNFLKRKNSSKNRTTKNTYRSIGKKCCVLFEGAVELRMNFFKLKD